MARNVPDRRSRLLALAAEYRAEAARHRATADRLEETAALLESRAGEESELPLTIGDERSKMSGNMQVDTTGQPRNVKIAAGRTHRMTRTKAAFITKGKTDGDIADELKARFKTKVARSTVNAWLAGTRPIPRRFVDYLRDVYGVAPTAWKRIAE